MPRSGVQEIKHQPKPAPLSLEALRALRVADQKRKAREYQRQYREGIRRKDAKNR